MTVLAAQLMAGEESTYGTPVTPTKTFEYESENIKLTPERDDWTGHRKNQQVRRHDRWFPGKRSAAGPISLILPTKSAGIWLKHGFGTSAIGSITDSNYTQTFTFGALPTGLTLQVARPYLDGTATPFTWHGCKMTSFEIVAEVGKAVMLNMEFDCEDEDNATSLATASYASSALAFSWAGCTVSLGGSSVTVDRFRYRHSNPLGTDRFRLGSNLKKQPLQNGLREPEWEVGGLDWEALTHYNRVVGATRSAAVAAIVFTATGPEIHAGATYPEFKITIPTARFDSLDDMGVDSWEELAGTYSGVALDPADGSTEPVTATYKTTDAAVV